jgi:hypothetical protein
MKGQQGGEAQWVADPKEMIFNYIFAKYIVFQKMAVLAQTSASLCKNWITALFFRINSENRRKSAKIAEKNL